MTALILAALGLAIAVEALRDREATRSATVGELAAARAIVAARLRRYAEERVVRMAQYERAWDRAKRPLYLASYGRRPA